MANIDWDTKDFDKGVIRLNDVMQKAATAALDKVANEVLRLSTYEVPHDEGMLQNSGSMEPVDDNEVMVGYNMVYAARLHEHPEYKFQKGRKGKYLIDPILQNLTAFKGFVEKQIQQSLG